MPSFRKIEFRLSAMLSNQERLLLKLLVISSRDEFARLLSILLTDFPEEPKYAIREAQFPCLSARKFSAIYLMSSANLLTKARDTKNSANVGLYIGNLPILPGNLQKQKFSKQVLKSLTYSHRLSK